MSRPLGRACLLVLLVALRADAADSGVLSVEPAELTTRPDLDGREVVLDDRVRLFQSHPGKGYDELYLKRTPVVFRLPPKLREMQTQNPKVVRLQGVMKRETDGWVCDVTALESMPEDLERLNREAAGLSARDAEGRLAQARWAERRGKDFKDDRLLARALELEGEAIRIEADRPATDPAKHWLTLAERARFRHLPEPEPSALAHQSFRYSLKAAKTSEDLTALRARVAAFFPQSPKSLGDNADLAKWLDPYDKNPAAAYRAASPAVRAALDHRLWADTTQRLLEARFAADPASGLTLADEAATALPEHPELAVRLLESGLKAAASDLGKLRLAEVEGLARVYRDRLRQPERAQSLFRDWLNDQRKNRLRKTDAEGRLLLAAQYETLLGDDSTAAELLQEAWKIDPDSKELADGFLRRDYRKVNGGWVKAKSARSSAAPRAEVDAPRPPLRDQQLRGSTPQEVRDRLGGNPDRVIRSISQGQMIEQWIYIAGKHIQYVNFRHVPGETRPKVVAYYSRTPTPAGR